MSPLELARFAVRELAACAEDAKDAADNAVSALRIGEPDAAEQAIARLTDTLGKQIGSLEYLREQAVEALRRAVVAGKGAAR